MSPALRALLGSRLDRPWRRSSLCAPGRARWVLGSAPDAFGMPFPPRRAGSSLAQPLETRARNAHYLAGPRTHWDAQTRSAPTRSPTPRDASNVPGPGAPAAGATSLRPGTLPVALWGHGPGSERDGPQIPSRFSSHNSLSGFCASTSPRGGSAFSLLSPRRPARPDSCLSSGSLSLSLFLSPAPFLFAVWLPRKSCFPKFAEVVSKPPWGRLGAGRGVGGSVRARSIPGARAG